MDFNFYVHERTPVKNAEKCDSRKSSLNANQDWDVSVPSKNG